MLSWLKKEPQDEGFIALDLGTQSIKAVIFSIEEKFNKKGDKIDEKAIIEGWGKVPLMTWNDSVLINHLDHVIEKSKQAINQAAQRAKFFPKKLILGIGGQYVKGATTFLKHKREEPDSKINLSELRNIIQKLEWTAFDKVRRQVSLDTGFSEIDIKLMDAEIGRITIDGYHTKNPLGFQGGLIEIALFNAFVPLNYYKAIQDIVKKLELECLKIVSIPYALSQLDSSEEKDLSAIFIDIGATNTQVSVAHKGGLVSTKTFALGGHSFTKRLAMELNINLEEAETLKKTYTNNELEQKSKKIISESLKDDLELWFEALILALSQVKMEDLPSTIFLSGGGGMLPEIRENLNQGKWYKKLHFSHQPQAYFLDPKNFSFMVDKKKYFKNQTNVTNLALVKASLNQEGKESIPQKTLKKVIGIMQV